MTKIEFRRGIEPVNVGIIRNRKGKILLIYAKRWNAWNFPGGHIEPGETIAESIKRECEEETGLKLEVADIINQGEFIDTVSFSEPIHLLYWHGVLDIIGDEAEYKLDEREHSDFRWVTPTEALTMRLAGDNIRESIEKYIKWAK